MSDVASISRPSTPPGPEHSASRQLRTLVRQEVRRSVHPRRLLPILLTAALPVVISLLRAVFLPAVLRTDLAATTASLSTTMHLFLFRFILFFCVAWLFVRVFRGEIADRSLHYSLLAPLPRRILVLGRYLGALVTAWLVFVPVTALVWGLHYAPHGLEAFVAHLGVGGVREILLYELQTVAACAAYGAVFLLAGLLVRNPMVPAALFLGWEMLTPLLPPTLKNVSVVHHLGAWAPVAPDLGRFVFRAHEQHPLAAAAALAAIVAAALVLATVTARRLEVAYSAD